MLNIDIRRGIDYCARIPIKILFTHRTNLQCLKMLLKAKVNTGKQTLKK